MKLVLAYDQAKDDATRNSAIDALNKDHRGFNFNYNFQKPRYAKQGEEEKKAALDPEKSKFDYDEHFNQDKYMEKYY